MKPYQPFQRIEEIDMLRGLSMLVMVLLHTNAYFLSIPFVFFLWDYGQFAVPVFIFCSSYLFFIKKYQLNTLKDIFSHTRKRLLRLLVPYYLFAAIYILLERFKEPAKITYQYLLSNLFIIEGISINWLVLLFVFFTFLMPLLSYLWNHKRLIFYFYTILSIVSAFLLIFYPFPFNYRFIMWLPWSLLVVFSFFIVESEYKKWFYPIAFFAGLAVFLSLRYLQITLHHSLTMFDNKYPPNLFHLSFGMVSIIGLYIVAKRGVFAFPLIKNLFSFLSRNSYSLYFIHWIVIYIVTVLLNFKFTWVSFFSTVFILAVIIQIFINRFSLWMKGLIVSRHYTADQQSGYSRVREG